MKTFLIYDSKEWRHTDVVLYKKKRAFSSSAFACCFFGEGREAAGIGDEYIRLTSNDELFDMSLIGLKNISEQNKKPPRERVGFDM